MSNEFLRRDDPGSIVCHQVLKERITRDKEVAVGGTAEYKNFVGMRHPIAQSSRSWNQSFSFGQINRQYAQMISDLFEFGATRTVYGQKEFLKYDRVYSDPDTPRCLGGKQLHGCWIASDVSDDHVGVQEHQWLIRLRTPAVLERLGIGHLFHSFIVRQQGQANALTLD
jgi:hypothetical protein